MFASLAPARRRLLLAVLAVLVVAVVVGAVAVFTSSRSGQAAAVPQDRPGPVLLVPGYGGSTNSLQPLATTLRAAGKDVTVVTLPGNAQGDLDEQARVLGVAARAAKHRTGAASVDVVGYSAGGVVARLWARDHGGASIARRVITLGSPHHGTELAALGTAVPGACPLACQQLAPDSALLTALNRGDETPAGPLWVSIWTDRDTVVLPPDSARLDGATDVTVQSLCAGDAVDHGGLPGDRVVAQVVLSQLAAVPGPITASC